MDNRALGLTWVLFSLFATSAQAIPTPPEKPKASVLISKIQKVDLFDRLTYPARVVARVNSTLLAETDGVVSLIRAGLGTRVGKGQPVLTITHTDPVYQYAPAQVVASVAGVVSSLDVTEGAQVAQGQKIGTITDPSRIRLVVEIPAQDLRSIRPGLIGELTVAGIEKPLSVKVRGVSPYVDPGTGTASCELDLSPRSPGVRALAPGELGQVAFKADLRKGFNIPDHAIIYKGNDPFVRLIEAGKSKRVAVKLGIKQRGFVEVLNGLTENAVLVERASRFVADGEEVAVQNPEAAK